MLLILLSCSLPPQPADVDLTALSPELPVALHRPQWPELDAPITPPPVEFPPDFGVRRVFLDAGHGAARNSGNTSAYCEKEKDVMAALSGPLAAALEATGHFEVLQARQPDELVPYRSRMSAAKSFGAEAFISLHSDSRGQLLSLIHI